MVVSLGGCGWAALCKHRRRNTSRRGRGGQPVRTVAIKSQRAWPTAPPPPSALLLPRPSSSLGPPPPSAGAGCRAHLLAQAPQTENCYVRVPKTAGGDGQGEGGAAVAAPAPAPALVPAASAAAAPAASSSSPAASAAPAAAAAGAPAAPAAAAAGAAAPSREVVHALDIRVGRIVSCERHPDAERYWTGRDGTGRRARVLSVPTLPPSVPCLRTWHALLR